MTSWDETAATGGWIDAFRRALQNKVADDLYLKRVDVLGGLRRVTVFRGGIQRTGQEVVLYVNGLIKADGKTPEQDHRNVGNIVDYAVRDVVKNMKARDIVGFDLFEVEDPALFAAMRVVDDSFGGGAAGFDAVRDIYKRRHGDHEG